MTVTEIPFRILIISQVVCMSVFSGLIDISSCPAGPLWKYRAAVVCKTPEQYHCLFDSFNSDKENTIYVERCFPPKRYKGKRYVVSGYLDAEDCQKENYSPYPITSNVNTGAECPLKKSLCNEEGQVTVSDGSSSEDRTCRCSFEEGYRYINEPPNPCNCYPFLEDCSCYRDKCSLVTGNVCKEPTYFSVLCEGPLNADTGNTGEDLDILPSHPPHYHVYVQHDDQKTLKIGVLILSVAAICIGAFSVVVAGRLDDSIEETFKPQETKHILPSCKYPMITKNTIHTEIYRENISCVEYYVPTVELDLLKEALLGRDRKHLVILEGMHGYGKTQTARKFCYDNSTSYSIVCQMDFDSRVPFVDTVGKLTRNLNINILDEDSTTMISNIEKYFRERDRDRLRSLIFLDKVDIENIDHYGNIRELIKLKDKFPNLNFIVATTDGGFSDLFRNKNEVSKVQFKGMDEQAYLKFFKNIIDDVDNIKKLVETIGPIPLVLNSAYLHLKRTKVNIEEYLKIYECRRHSYPDLKMFDGVAYDKNAITSQIASLKFIEKQLYNDKRQEVWEIVKFLHYLCYGSISVSVLEALYFHKVKRCSWIEKKDGINEAIKTLQHVCLCDVEDSRTGNEDRLLSFHDVTMFALGVFTKERDEHSDLLFLLKTFCYEIDIDSRTDLTVKRNLRFIDHAEKLLSRIEDSFTDDSLTQFFQSYLHCAIGSTLLFQRLQINKAHKHLTKARSTVFRLVNGIETADLSEMGKIASMSYEKSLKLFTTDDIRNFVTEKRRNPNDLDVIKTTLPEELKLDLYESFYLSEHDYKVLVDSKMALGVEDIKNLILAELILRILHNNTIAISELTYIDTETEENNRYKDLKEKCYAESLKSRKLCHEVCNPSEGIGNFKMFVCLEIERSGLMLMRRYKMELQHDGMNIRQELETDIVKYEKMIENYDGKTNISDGIYFDFGIVKISPKRYIRHTALCRWILLRYLMTAYDEVNEPEEKSTIYEKCTKVTKELEKQLEEMLGTTTRSCWLSLPLLYIRCGRCHLMPENPKLEHALNCFEKALLFENNRDAPYSRFTVEGYEGKIDCLVKLGRIKEAIDVADEVIKKNEGKNRDNIVVKFQTLRDQIKSSLIT